jgi:hypothetical protein
LANFKEFSDHLEADKSPTLQLVMPVYFLAIKLCDPADEDSAPLEQFKLELK